jgi:hypothetical protein
MAAHAAIMIVLVAMIVAVVMIGRVRFGAALA